MILLYQNKGPNSGTIHHWKLKRVDLSFAPVEKTHHHYHGHHYMDLDNMVWHCYNSRFLLYQALIYHLDPYKYCNGPLNLHFHFSRLRVKMEKFQPNQWNNNGIDWISMWKINVHHKANQNDRTVVSIWMEEFSMRDGSMKLNRHDSHRIKVRVPLSLWMFYVYT